MKTTVFEKRQPSNCEGWLCAIATPQQFVTMLAASAGIALIGLMIVRLGEIADVGSGLAGLMAVGLVLLSLPVIGKMSLSFAANQTVFLEFKTTPSAENICNTANLVTEINEPLSERLAKLEQDLRLLERSSSIARPTVASTVQRRPAGIRIFCRGTRAADAEKLQLALTPLFSFVDALKTALTEVGDTPVPNFNRIRYETVPADNWLGDADIVKSIVIRELGNVDKGPDAVARTLPGNIQVLLY